MFLWGIVLLLPEMLCGNRDPCGCRIVELLAFVCTVLLTLDTRSMQTVFPSPSMAAVCQSLVCLSCLCELHVFGYLLVGALLVKRCFGYF